MQPPRWLKAGALREKARRDALAPGPCRYVSDGPEPVPVPAGDHSLLFIGQVETPRME